MNQDLNNLNQDNHNIQDNSNVMSNNQSLQNNQINVGLQADTIVESSEDFYSLSKEAIVLNKSIGYSWKR